MASPVGHSLAGAFIWLILNKGKSLDLVKKHRKELLFYILLANIPDIDFLAGLVFYGHPNIIHGRITHSILFAVTVSAVIAAVSRIGQQGRLKGRFWAYTALILSHDFMDIFSARTIGFARGEGIALFYPFIEYKISSPVSIFYGIGHKNLSQILSVRNLNAVLFEVIVFTVLIAVIYFQKNRKKHYS